VSAVLAALDAARSPLGRRLVDDDFLDDPYPTYQALREAGPIHWSDEFFGGAWLLTRHDDVEMVLRDPRFSARRTGGWVMGTGDGARAELKGFQSLYARAMLFLDAPDHQRIRRVLSAGFRPEVIQRLVPDIETLVDELLDGLDAEGEFDLMQRLARPLPARVIAKLMGIEDSVLPCFIIWSDDLAEFTGAVRPTLEQARRAQVSLMAMSRYFESRLQGCGASDDDLVSRLAQATRAGDIKDGPELLSQCAMLLFAGHETTRNLLGNGLYHLLARPPLWRALQREPRQLPTAIRELLRFDSPVQYTGRRVAADLVMHGQVMRRGDLAIGLIGAANRDPQRYEEPDRLDLSRRGASSLSFGWGPHACIGATLTLTEAEMAFRRILQRWPNLSLAKCRPQWKRNPLYRGLSALTVHNRA
jgi:cytochrome P450